LCDTCSEHNGHEAKEIKEGREEAERFGNRLHKSLDGRILDEVKDYNERYGIASPADVATEINSRGKDLHFQGELYSYAYKDLGKIQKRMDELVKEGKLRKVKVHGAKSGYVWRSHKNGKKYSMGRR